MNHRSIRIKTFIIITSILILLLEYGCYYFFNSLFVSIAFAIVLNLIGSHIYLESSLTYSSCFLQSKVTVLLSSVLTIFIYTHQAKTFLIYHKYLPVLILLNWLVPLFYSILRNFMDHGPRFVQFRTYFWKTSILFLFYYIYSFLQYYVITPVSLPFDGSKLSNPLIPFLATASFIEDCIYLGQPLSVLFIYLIKTILLFVPLGFYTFLLLKKASRTLIILLTFLLPLVATILSFVKASVFYIDVYFYNLIGFLLGILLYQLLNQISHHRLKTSFLSNRSKYSFFNPYF